MKTKVTSYDEIKSLGTLGRIEIERCTQHYCKTVDKMFRMRTKTKEEANACIEMFHQEHDPIIVPQENLLYEVEKIIANFKCNYKAKIMKQKELKVKIKKLHLDAVVPSYAHSTDCGLDLTAVSKTFDEYGNVVYGFGLAFEIPEGYSGFIFPRSSNHKSELLLTNSVGVIDAGFRGEVTAKFASRINTSFPKKLWHRLKYFFTGKIKGYDMNTWCHFSENLNYNIGDRVAQMVILPYPKVEFEEVDELSDTERGTGGYGSTGK